MVVATVGTGLVVVGRAVEATAAVGDAGAMVPTSLASAMTVAPAVLVAQAVTMQVLVVMVAA